MTRAAQPRSTPASQEREARPMGCDTMVALAPATRAGVTLFAKNSDRPPRECQRIVQLPAAGHREGSTVRCQYLELPQARETHAIVGSQPYWLWGVVFLQHAGFFQLASIAVRSDFDFPVGDVAVLKLATPLTAVRPSPIAQAAPAIGTAGTIPANDPGWEGSNPAHGSYKWRGDGTLAGLRRITIRDKSASRGRFELRFTGRTAPAVNPAGTRVTLVLGGVCVASAP